MHRCSLRNGKCDNPAFRILIQLLRSQDRAVIRFPTMRLVRPSPYLTSSQSNPSQKSRIDKVGFRQQRFQVYNSKYQLAFAVSISEGTYVSWVVQLESIIQCAKFPSFELSNWFLRCRFQGKVTSLWKVTEERNNLLINVITEITIFKQIL